MVSITYEKIPERTYPRNAVYFSFLDECIQNLYTASGANCDTNWRVYVYDLLGSIVCEDLKTLLVPVRFKRFSVDEMLLNENKAGADEIDESKSSFLERMKKCFQVNPEVYDRENDICSIDGQDLYIALDLQFAVSMSSKGKCIAAGKNIFDVQKSIYNAYDLIAFRNASGELISKDGRVLMSNKGDVINDVSDREIKNRGMLACRKTNIRLDPNNIRTFVSLYTEMKEGRENIKSSAGDIDGGEEYVLINEGGENSSNYDNGTEFNQSDKRTIIWKTINSRYLYSPLTEECSVEEEKSLEGICTDRAFAKTLSKSGETALYSRDIFDNNAVGREAVKFNIIANQSVAALRMQYKGNNELGI